MEVEDIERLKTLAFGSKSVKSEAGEVEERSAKDIILLLNEAKKAAHKGRQLDRFGFYRTKHIDRN